MLRLRISCQLIPEVHITNSQSRTGSCVLRFRSVRNRSRWNHIKALNDEREGGASGFAGQSWNPGLEIEVPFEQRPVNEYSSLKDGPLYSWGELSPGAFFLRLGGLWLVTFTVLGAPIAAASFNPSRDPLRFMLAAGTGTLFLVSLVVLRIYLGWSYVGDRLLSAVIPYEESGWYDGQMWVKPPEVLARDRLLGSYKVVFEKPGLWRENFPTKKSIPHEHVKVYRVPETIPSYINDSVISYLHLFMHNFIIA
ncbi:DUF1230 family protein (DUF1230) isoform X5 [Tasmannia lanceolata]|uniref:DUF1230 family protein (DUF1230) isoform X5 n=1 Tax=Tasmannia lanceolata TaxID=3420 RepID=UPI0040634875